MEQFTWIMEELRGQAEAVQQMADAAMLAQEELGKKKSEELQQALKRNLNREELLPPGFSDFFRGCDGRTNSGSLHGSQAFM